LSKKHGHRKKRRRKAARERASSPAVLLDGAARALNSLADAGLEPRLVQGAVMTSAGYVLFLPERHRKRDRWQAKVQTAHPMSPRHDPSGLDD
jgi:hypothetical protein